MIGDHDDLDMRGIRREWYENDIRREWHDALRGFGEELRFIWNHHTRRPVIVCKVPGVDTLYHGGFLEGWSIVMHCDRLPFDANYYATLVGQMKRLNQYSSAEAMEEEIDSEIQASKAKKKAGRDKELSDFIDSEYPRGLIQENAIVRDGERMDALARDEISTMVQRRKRRGKISTE